MSVNVDSINAPRLTVAQTAARLHVKPATVYAYVSRGLLTTRRSAEGSTLDALEVEGFAQRRRAARSGRATDGVTADKPATGGSPLLVLDTDIAFIADGELFFRGVPAASLAHGHDYESVARWLWGEALTSRASLDAELGDVAAARRAIAALPGSASTLDHIQTAVTALAAADPLRHDATPEALRRAGAGMIAGVVLALGPASPAGPGRGTDRAVHEHALAARLWVALTGREASEPAIRALNTALVLMIDHDLAVSTLAARVAASARASGYAVVTSALGALDAALHGDASRAAAQLVRQVVDGSEPEAALAASIVQGARGIPGFGHPLYPKMDARAALLFRALREIDGAGPVLAAVDRLAGTVERRAGLHPNVDLALAALVLAADMPTDAGTAIFAIGRMGGWIAHALDEYAQPPMRLRPHGRYVGPRAASIA